MKLIEIACPLCAQNDSSSVAEENGFYLHRCQPCGFLYVNPRPDQGQIDEAVQTGVHTHLGGHNVQARRIDSKVKYYSELFKSFAPDIFSRSEPISWLDIGAGYGEIMESVLDIAPKDSQIHGIEPMEPKAKSARQRNLQVQNGYLSDVENKFEFASLIHVFSHIPDFSSFLEEVKSILKPNGEFIVETGNLADVKDIKNVPGELDLPDHLTFGGKDHLVQFLENAGFEIISIQEIKRNEVLDFIKIIVKKLIGRKVKLVWPGKTELRNLIVRARLPA